MPLKRCQKDGKPGWKFGDEGKCFTGPNARARAAAQGRAIQVSQQTKDMKGGDDNLGGHLIMVSDHEAEQLLNQIPVFDIIPDQLKALNNQRLQRIHDRLHKLWKEIGDLETAETSEGRLTKEDIFNAHEFVRLEFEDRGMSLPKNDEISRASIQRKKSVPEWISGRLAEFKDAVLVPAYVSLVGSAVDKDKPGDVDVLVREDYETMTEGWRESIWLLVRKLLDPKKLGLKLHVVANAQGPHLADGQKYVPVFDLVLRPREGVEFVDKAAPFRVDLGCGSNKAEGFFGIDIKEGKGVDLVHDLESGIPLPDNSVDEIRASHSIEHLGNPKEIMMEIWRVLKPNGTAFIAVPSTKGEGAWAHPEHKSQWNKLSFQFYSDDELRSSINFDGKFDILNIEEKERSGSNWETVEVRAILQAVKTPAETTQKAIKSPMSSFTPPKPAVPVFIEFFDVSDLWDKWAQKRIEDGKKIAIEPKLNGFRTLARKEGDDVKLESEGGVNRTKSFPDIVAQLKKIPGNYILDGDLAIEKGGKRVFRPDMATLNADKPVIPKGARIVFTAFDLPFLNEDLSGMPWEERHKKLKDLSKKFGSLIELLRPTRIVNSRSALESATKAVGKQQASEGAVLKVTDSTYPSGSTNEWSKVKHRVELKVLAIGKKKAGTAFNYTGALAATKKWPNAVDFQGQKVVKLGDTFNTKVDVGVGSILTTKILELFVDDKGNLVWLGASVEDVDRDRKRPFSDNSAISIAKRGGVWQARVTKELTKKDDDWYLGDDDSFTKQKTPEGEGGASGGEGETRAERAAEFWRKNWFKSFPKSGGGRFVYHHHWRGLEKDRDGVDETKKSDGALMNTDNSVHGDWRFTFDDALWGFTVFIGDTADNRRLPQKDKLIALKPEQALQGSFKLQQPKVWLNVGRRAPFVAEPGEVGSTRLKHSKFFAKDFGTYEMGFWKQNFFEIFVKGKHLKGRYIFTFAPIGGRRIWLVRKPKDQEPFIDSNELEDIIADQKKKGRKFIVWAKPGTKPKLIDVRKGSEVKKALPQSIRGWNVGETFSRMSELGRKFSQDESNYFQPAESSAVVCGNCRFFLRDQDAAIGTCQVVGGPIAWFGICDLQIDATAESAAAFALNPAFDGGERVQRAWPIIKASPDGRFVVAPVLVPDEPDLEGDIISGEEIERAAHDFMEHFQNVGLMHQRIMHNKDVVMVESTILRDNMTIAGKKFKKGTWIGAFRIHNEKLREAVRSGKLTGVSIGGSGVRTPID